MSAAVKAVVKTVVRTAVKAAVKATVRAVVEGGGEGGWSVVATNDAATRARFERWTRFDEARLPGGWGSPEFCNPL